MNHDDIIANRAYPTSPAEHADTCSDGGPHHRCDGVLLFAMQDNHHTFTMDLVTILQCVKMAEEEGGIPELPEDWWQEVVNRYNMPTSE